MLEDRGRDVDGYFHDLNELGAQEMPGRRRRLVVGENVMLVHVEREAGTSQDHAHPQEQLVHLLAGRARFTVGGETREVGPGTVARIPPGVRHQMEALTPVTYLGIYSPPREEVIRGDA